MHWAAQQAPSQSACAYQCVVTATVTTYTTHKPVSKVKSASHIHANPTVQETSRVTTWLPTYLQTLLKQASIRILRTFVITLHVSCHHTITTQTVFNASKCTYFKRDCLLLLQLCMYVCMYWSVLTNQVMTRRCKGKAHSCSHASVFALWMPQHPQSVLR